MKRDDIDLEIPSAPSLDVDLLWVVAVIVAVLVVSVAAVGISPAAVAVGIAAAQGQRDEGEKRRSQFHFHACPSRLTAILPLRILHAIESCGYPSDPEAPSLLAHAEDGTHAMIYNKGQWTESFEGQLSLLRPHLPQRVLATMSNAAWHEVGAAGEDPIKAARALSKLLDERPAGQ